MVVLALSALPLRGAEVLAARQMEPRINEMLSRMTLEEKIALLHGNTLFTVAPVDRLGIPRMVLSDGPRGVREDFLPDAFKPAGGSNDYATALPCGSALAATWDREAARRFGDVLGAEARDRKKDIILGPSLNIQRVPLCGRNFEYLSEDPFLAASLAVPEIRAIQANDVAACAKHFVCNNQELDRYWVNAKVSERALREIYLPAFEAAVTEGGVLAVMGAYNTLNGEACCQNARLISILKQDWGFQGILMSDWGIAPLQTLPAALNGLDLEMGTAKPFNQYFLADPLLAAVKAGQVPVAAIDEKVRRHLRVLFALHAMGGGPRRTGSRNTPGHAAASRGIAAESIVLLKNDRQQLPLDGARKEVVVIGANACLRQDHGGGSSEIKALYEVTPLQGLQKALGTNARIAFYPGYTIPPRAKPGQAAAAEAAVQSAQAKELRAAAVAAAKDANTVIYIGGLTHDQDVEGEDRPDMKLPYGQDQLIAELLEANPKTIIVLVGGSPVEMPWIGQAATVLWMYYGGQEAGAALADVLTGVVSPSGHLPTTFPKRFEDSPAAVPGAYSGHVEEYKEGVFVGYRWFDAREIEPLFPFGHGLTYSKFDFSGFKAVEKGEEVKLALTVKNAGRRAAAEVVQFYVGQAKASAERPVRELKGFTRVQLEPGQSRRVELTLPRRAFAYWSEARNAWTVEPGQFVIEAGVSSRDIRAKQAVEIQ